MNATTSLSPSAPSDAELADNEPEAEQAPRPGNRHCRKGVCEDVRLQAPRHRDREGMRQCLRCPRPFWSLNAGNRICPSCHKIIDDNNIRLWQKTGNTYGTARRMSL